MELSLLLERAYILSSPNLKGFWMKVIIKKVTAIQKSARIRQDLEDFLIQDFPTARDGCLSTSDFQRSLSFPLGTGDVYAVEETHQTSNND